MDTKETEPVWTPDGGIIVYEHKDSIYSVTTDGKQLKTLAYGDYHNYEINRSPAISPNGQRIVYSTTRHRLEEDNPGTRNADLELMDIDGSNKTRLTSSPAWDINPMWDHTGHKVIFIRQGGFKGLGEADIDGAYTIDIDGWNLRRLAWTYNHIHHTSQRNGRFAVILSEDSLAFSLTGRVASIWETKEKVTYEEKGDTFLATADANLDYVIEHRKFPNVSFPNPENTQFQTTPMEKVVAGIALSPDGDKIAYIAIQFNQTETDEAIAYKDKFHQENYLARSVLKIVHIDGSREESIKLEDTNCMRFWGISQGPNRHNTYETMTRLHWSPQENTS